MPAVLPGHQHPSQPGEGVWALVSPWQARAVGGIWAATPCWAGGAAGRVSQAQAEAGLGPRLPRSPRQEELAADVSPCANLWLLASGASTRLSVEEEAWGLVGPRGPAARAWATWADWPATMALGPEGLVLESGEEAGRGWAGVWGPRCGVAGMAHEARRCPPVSPACCRVHSGGPSWGPRPLQAWFPKGTVWAFWGPGPPEVVSEHTGPASRAARDPEVGWCLQDPCGPGWGCPGA